MLKAKHIFLGLASVVVAGCTLGPQKEFSPELQRGLVPFYVAADMEDRCSNVSWDDNGVDQHESKVLSIAAQSGVTRDDVIKHMTSDNWMTVEETYFFGFLSEYNVESIEDYDARICTIARDEDRKNSDVGKLITVK